MRAPRLSPMSYRRLTLAALFALAFIVVTGAAVRLTGSGLGCPEWPTCGGGNVVAPLEYHAMVEFVNRVVTGLVSVAVILAVLGSLVRVPRRRDLTLLSLGLVAGVAGQVVLGGLVVLFHLAPPLVMGHFVLSMILLWNATVLHHRASEPGGPARPTVGSDHVLMTRLLVVMAAVVIFTGTIVTGAGPHAGSHDGELVDRLPLEVAAAARVHGMAVVLFLALILVTVVTLRRIRSPRSLTTTSGVLLGVVVAQAGIGYAQYFTGVPALLVGLHIAGSVAVWVAAIRLTLATHTREQAAGRQSHTETQAKTPVGLTATNFEKLVQ